MNAAKRASEGQAQSTTGPHQPVEVLDARPVDGYVKKTGHRQERQCGAEAEANRLHQVGPGRVGVGVLVEGLGSGLHILLVVGAGTPQQHNSDGHQSNWYGRPGGANERAQHDPETLAEWSGHIGPNGACRHQPGEDEPNGDDVGAVSGPNRGRCLPQSAIR